MVEWGAQLACCDGQVYMLFRKSTQGIQRIEMVLSGKLEYFWILSRIIS